MTRQQLITIVTLQLVAVIAVGWYLVLEHSSDRITSEPSLDSLPATPALAPPPLASSDNPSIMDMDEYDDENDMHPFEFHFIE